MTKYIKKPVVIDAIQWTGKNEIEISEFIGEDITWSVLYPGLQLIIPTLEGDHRASVGDFIIRGVHGEYYPCKPDIFEETYNMHESEVAEPMQAVWPDKMPDVPYCQLTKDRWGSR